MPLETGAKHKTFRWDDPLGLASRLTKDERMTGAAARAYARDTLSPRVVGAFAQERFDREIMTEMGADVHALILGRAITGENAC